MTLVRLALVGFGRWGRNYIRAAQDSGEAEVTHIVTRGPAEPEQVGAPHVWLDDLGGIKDCDAVIYAGHPSGAADICERALAWDVPVLVEKPAGLSLDAAKRIAAAEKASKAFVLVGHQHLFAEGYEALVDWRRYNPGTAHADWRGPGPVRDYSALWDYGPHAVSVLLGLRHAEPWWRPDPGDMEHVEADADKALMIWFQGTERVQARVSRVHDRKEARVYFWDECTRADHGPSYDAYAPAEPALTRQVRAFATAVRNGGSCDWRFGAKWAVDVAKVLEAASCASARAMQ